MLKKGLALLLAVIMVFSLSGCSDILGGAFFLFLVATGDDSADKDEVFDFVSENEEELLNAIEAGDFSAYENKGFIKEIAIKRLTNLSVKIGLALKHLYSVKADFIKLIKLSKK